MYKKIVYTSLHLLLCCSLLIEQLLPTGRISEIQDHKYSSSENTDNDWSCKAGNSGNKICIYRNVHTNINLNIYKEMLHSREVRFKFRESNKLSNSRTRARNGNRTQSFHIVHWNLGSKKLDKEIDRN